MTNDISKFNELSDVERTIMIALGVGMVIWLMINYPELWEAFKQIAVNTEPDTKTPA